MQPKHTPAAARDVLKTNRYLVLATATPEGTPWITPVYFAHDDLASLWWVSRPTARHSRLIRANPEVAITVFDSSVAVGQAAAVYAVARASMRSDAEARREIARYSERSVSHDAGPWTVEDVTGDAVFRLYRAVVSRRWLLAGDGPDARVPVPTGVHLHHPMEPHPHT